MNRFSDDGKMAWSYTLLQPPKRDSIKSALTLSTSLLMGLLLSSTAHTNDHKALGMITMSYNATNDLTLRILVCRVVERTQPTADRGDIELNGASVYFKAVHVSSQDLNVPSSIKERQTTDWITINSDNDNKRCVFKTTFSGQSVSSSDIAMLKAIGDD